MSVMPRLRGRALTASLGGAIALLAAGAAVAAPTAAASSEPATVELSATEGVLGGTIGLSGENWLSADGSQGSVIAIKFDMGAYSRLPAEQVHANLTIWEIVEAGDDGSFSVDLPLPTGLDSGAGGSTPAFPTGAHTIQLLTGSLLPGDTIRSVQTPEFTVTEDSGEPDPEKPQNATVELAATELAPGDTLEFASAGFTPGAGLYTVSVDDGALFTAPAGGNADGTLSVSALSLGEYGIGAGEHTLSVAWAADDDVLASAPFTVTEDGEEPEPGDSAGITITAEIPEPGPGEGALTLSIPDAAAGIDLGEGENAGDRIVFSGALPTVIVTDSRSDDEAAGGGWSTSGQVSDFVNGETVLDGSHLGWVPEVLTPKDGLTAGAPVASGLDGGGDGLSAPSTLATAAGAGRAGSAELGAGLDLLFPVDAAPGTYESTITVSLFPTD